RRAMTPTLSTLLLQCNDQIRLLVDAAAGTQDADAEAAQQRQALVEKLKTAYGADKSSDTPGATSSAAPAASALSVGKKTGRWHISVIFGAETYRNGMDPLAILNYVRNLGVITEVKCNVERVPLLDGSNPEDCHLGFEFDLDTAASESEIEAAF